MPSPRCPPSPRRCCGRRIAIALPLVLPPDSGALRLRPILLTTGTTIFGILPLLLERSFQARFLIPMGISIAAGLLSATVLTLLILPANLMIIDDIRRGLRVLWGSADDDGALHSRP